MINPKILAVFLIIPVFSSSFANEDEAMRERAMKELQQYLQKEKQRKSLLKAKYQKINPKHFTQPERLKTSVPIYGGFGLEFGGTFDVSKSLSKQGHNSYYFQPSADSDFGFSKYYVNLSKNNHIYKITGYTSAYGILAIDKLEKQFEEIAIKLKSKYGKSNDHSYQPHEQLLTNYEIWYYNIEGKPYDCKIKLEFSVIGENPDRKRAKLELEYSDLARSGRH